MATARALQRLSRYPLVVLTNATRLPGGADVARSLARLNAQVLPVYDVGMPHGALSDDQQRYRRARAREFDKLIWLDTSAVLTRSVDWLFKRRATWLQGDGGSCGTRAGRLPGDGIMLVAPSEAVYQHMVRFAATLSAEWWAASRIASRSTSASTCSALKAGPCGCCSSPPPRGHPASAGSQAAQAPPLG
ncbi:unnamed protein product [Prorocentrum cordatum]|uniref:Uncharacterized protein n=1 Tax=Prorocentrum cordatum TaxID=2364126 RepID=A0ABN9QUM7_9DINO|nr:unnamed protein product [Polarella glacialis]